MATLGRWTGSAINIVPTETWAAPNGMFPTQSRNDSSTYSFASSTSTLTLPSSGLADGYLIVGAFEFENAGNNRCMLSGRITQASGTGTFVGSPTGGYYRNGDDDRLYVRCWAVVDNPSASATFQFEWRRDAEAANASSTIVSSELLVIPLFYSDIGLYSSTSAAAYGGTTPNVVAGWSGTDGTNITRSGNVVTVAGDNKRYLIFGAQYYEGYGDTRTQRWVGLEIDNAQENAAKGYFYSRFAAEDETGAMYTWLLQTATANVTIENTCYRGDGVANGEGGGSDDGANPSSAAHSLVVIELNDSAEVFRSVDGTGGQNLTATGPIDLNLFRSADINFTDGASFAPATDTGMEAKKAMDGLFGANISAASNNVSGGARWTAKAEFTVDGAEQTGTMHGNFQRGNTSFGWSANTLSFLALAANEDVGVSVTERTTSEGGGGDISSPAGWAGIWGINLDTLEASTTNTGALSVTEAGDVISSSGEVTITGETSETEAPDSVAAEGSLTITGGVSATEGSDTSNASGTLVIQADASITEIGDTLASAGGAPQNNATLSVTEAGDSSSATGQLTIRGSTAAVEGADGLSSEGQVTIQAATAVTEGPDSVSSTGKVGSGVTGAVDVTEQGDSLAATGHVESGAPEITRGGDDAPFRPETSGQSRRYFYDKQVEEIERRFKAVEKAPPKQVRRAVRRAKEAVEEAALTIPAADFTEAFAALDRASEALRALSKRRMAVRSASQLVKTEVTKVRTREKRDREVVMLLMMAA